VIREEITKENMEAHVVIFVLVLNYCLFVYGGSKAKADKIGKRVTDYNDVDVEKLLDQWNENDDDDDDDDEGDSDDPRHRKNPPKIDMEKVLSAGGSKEELFKASKKGQPLMMFANVAGNPSKQEVETITGLWQTSLRNNNIQAQRYIVGEKRVLFQLEDGSVAFQIKDYLVTLDNCESVSFDNMEFPGKGKVKTEL